MTSLDSHMVPKFVSVKRASELYEWPVGGHASSDFYEYRFQ